MKALRFYGSHNLRLEDVPRPDPGPGEVRVKPMAVGICGTDQHILDGSYNSCPPLTLGHEVAGFVDAVGHGVRGIREGDLITVEPHRYCGVCRYCRLGKEHLCLEKRAFGVHLDGGMAEYEVIPERAAYRLPDGMDPRVGALCEPLSCCVHGMDRLAPRSGMSIVVFGAGPAGLMLVGLCRLAGLTSITVVEPDANPLETSARTQPSIRPRRVGRMKRNEPSAVSDSTTRSRPWDLPESSNPRSGWLRDREPSWCLEWRIPAK